MNPHPLKVCPECGEALPGNAPLGLCPRCVLRRSFEPLDEPAPEPGPAPDTRPVSALSDAGPLRRVGGYELLQEIGRGGMGVVYKARQPSLSRIVALKLIMPSRLASLADIQRFKREAETAARLDHPHILPIYEVGESDGQPFYVMKYVEGGSLAARMAAYALPAAAAFARQSKTVRRRQQLKVALLVKKLSEAVAYAHQCGVLHRDLKPGNVLLDVQGEPYVADFGLAKWMDQDTGLTRSLVGIGTPGYAAPEQLGEGDQRQTTAADVYGIGAILYELLTGKVPCRRSSTLATIKAVMEEPAKPPHRIVRGVDQDLETICLKCLEKNPSHRYQTALGLADELGRFIEGRPVAARPVSTAGHLARWCKRKPALATALAGVALALVIGFIGVTWQWRLANAHAQALRQESYFSGIALADFHIGQGDMDRAIEILLQCPEPYRHWEWGYLMYRCHQDALSIPAHTNIQSTPRELASDATCFVKSVGFDPSGTLLATLGRDGSLRIWNVHTGVEVAALGGEVHPITVFAFPPGDQTLAVGHRDGQLRMLDRANGKPRFSVAICTNALNRLAYDPSGDMLAVAADNGRVWVCQALTGKTLASAAADVGAVVRMTFTPDGRGLVVHGSDRAAVHDLATGRKLSEPGGTPARRETVVVDPQGQRVVRIDPAGGVELHSAGMAPVSLEAIRGSQPDFVRRVFFSRDGQWFCTGGEEGTAVVYRSADGRPWYRIPHRVHHAEFSPDAQLLATLGAEHVVRIWDVNSRRELKVLRGHEHLVAQVAFSPDGSRVASADFYGVVKVWSARPGREVLEGDGWMWGLAVSPDGQSIAASPWAPELRIWDAANGRERLRIETPFHCVCRAVFSPDGTRIATTSGSDRTARVWDARTSAWLLTLRGHARMVLGVNYSPDGTCLATTSAGGTVKLWEAQTGRELASLDHGTNDVWGATFSPDGKRLVTTSELGIRVWEVKTARVRASMDRPGPGEGEAQWDRSGERIFTWGWDQAIRVLDARTAREERRFLARGTKTWAGALHPGGSRLIVDSGNALFSGLGHDQPCAEVFDVTSGRSLLRLQGHRESFNQFTFANDGRRFISASFDSTVRQWETFPWNAADYSGSEGEPLRTRIRHYADGYWRERLAAEQAGQLGAVSTQERAVSVPDRSLWPARSSSATSNQLDLTDHYTGILTAWFYPHFSWERSDDDLTELPVGLIVLAGVAFDVRGVIQLRRSEPLEGLGKRSWEVFPVQVEGIPVGRTFHRLHALLATDLKEAEGRTVGRLVGRYAGGERLEFPIIYGEDVRCWWEWPNDPSEVKRGRVAWRGSNPAAARENASLRLYVSTWENPRPDVEVKTLDLMSELTGAAPFVIAITVE